MNRQRKRLLTGLLTIGLVAASSGFAQEAPVPEAPREATVSTDHVAPRPPGQHLREMTFIKRQWGVEVMYVRQSAAGYMLEFRYRVLDPKKAKPLFVRRTKPVLTHEESGAKLIVPTPPTTGALRNSNEPIAGRIYWMLFANPGKLVKPGEHVSVEIGEFRVDGLIVE